MKKVYLVICTSLAIVASACSTINEAIGIAGEKGAEANDAMLVNAERVICNAASVGAVERRYNTPELLKAREEICKRVQRIRTPITGT